MEQTITQIHADTSKRGISERNIALTLFFVMSLLVAMSITQEETPEVGSIEYWLLVFSSLLLPLVNGVFIAKYLTGRAWPLLMFGLSAGLWHLAAGDVRAVLQLSLMLWVVAWVGCDRAKLLDKDLARLYVMLILVGTCIWLVSDQNKWGLLPYTTWSEYAEGGWRISLYPNIANSAVLSLGLFLVLTRSRSVMYRFLPVLVLATYFMVFSFVRTALVGLSLYLFMRWWLSRKPRSARGMFWTALLLGVGVNLLIAVSVPILAMMQDVGLFARLFLRNESGLTDEAIYAQLYRPWLWLEHLQLFLSSPGMMGLGVFDLSEVQLQVLNVGTTPAGNEAILTRLLATYGLPALLFIYYLISCLREAAQRRDAWACACFPTIVLLMMLWGNIFHPTDANGVLFMLIVARGSRAFEVVGSSRCVRHV